MKLGVCYYPEQWDRARWRDDAGRMATMGLKLVRIAEFAWARMEPREGQFDWEWLDEAVATLAEAGLEVVLGTPTAAPPRWLTERYPEVLAVDAQGRTRAAGSRRHVCLSSQKYFDASQAIVIAMAQRYGRHPAVVAWQTDNEYGCHDTLQSYSPQALTRFREWLRARYGSIEELNRRWGNVFWSMTCDGFEQIGLPVGLPAQANPIHALDWRRFASDEVLRFNRMQVDALREHAPGRPVLHNFMGFFGEFDHHAMGRDLDLASWDSYPLGHTDSTSFIDPDDRLRWARSGHPDIAAFHHDLYRGIGRGRFGVMEQQAGPVNWAPWNPAPQPGQVRAWTWEAFAHRAEFVSYFRWRQLPYAQEQMHSGLHDSDDHVTPGGEEAARVASELPAVHDTLGEEAPTQAPVALVLDYTSHWMIEIQRQGADASYFGDAFALYGAARRLGLDVDIVGPDAPLDGRSLVLVPALLSAEDTFARQLAAAPGQVVIGARSGSKTGDFRIADGLPPGPLADHAGLRVRSVESLRPGLSLRVSGAVLQGHARAWREHVDPAPDTDVLARFEDGGAAVLRRGRMRYLAATFDNDLLDAIVGAAARDAGLSPAPLPEGLRLRRRGRVQFAFHSGPGRARVPAPAGATWLLGGPDLDPAGVAAWIVD
ncbi:MAG TPA: beta-galactosidase [Burkholderiaceae bacterium]|jgi:beta-galactosidase|nr:beta-galactosidase [Burkholderiaceae bacterium]